MNDKFILTNVRLVFALITIIGAAVITNRVLPADLYPTLRHYFTVMVILGIGLDIVGRYQLSARTTEQKRSRK
ncbi:hypothetical protein [Lactiplantibacillus modestisalitolerans]|uniref:Integral membrane protein n=1 Tax=Lactiplantibacillus modestisalitolerans TaxID=1457219 RepID=A0ABV5WRS2_9LACO|nr:hypothetical protein [Lactiplantibacillus modestisalitolerans]